jgi:small subunit ribosomal protein S4
MSKYIGPSCRLCRREGEQLFLKGDRCYSDKCAVKRRSTPPGERHRRSSIKYSDYGQQLRAKQKAKRTYGVLEKTFRRYFKRAERQKGITGENLLRILESRLDNTVYRLGFASSRSEARELVSHKHFLVNGKRVNVPSYVLKSGDIIQVREKSQQLQAIQQALETVQQRGIVECEWLELDAERKRGVFSAIPTKEQIQTTIEEQLIVEFYSR